MNDAKHLAHHLVLNASRIAPKKDGDEVEGETKDQIGAIFKAVGAGGQKKEE